MDLLGFFVWFDPTYMLFVALPAVLLAAWAQGMVQSAYARARRIPARSGLSGAEAAQRILNVHGIADVAIEPVQSFLGDHYDPKRRVLRLSPDVYHGRSLASLGIAAHEAGHAIQDACAYAPLAIRNGLVPMASVGSNLSVMLIIAGLMLTWMTGLAGVGQTIAAGGLVLFGIVVLFQIVNLPVEFDASRRAREVLVQQGMVTLEEDRVVRKVLNAAAMTYVAATITAVLHLLYYASLIYGGRRD
ncbi:MAG: zinc metallopeptidase [Planctomycetota bacterium]|nr:MAG: zinc metallopeptidase [Planctomycetota bacterium]